MMDRLTAAQEVITGTGGQWLEINDEEAFLKIKYGRQTNMRAFYGSIIPLQHLQRAVDQANTWDTLRLRASACEAMVGFWVPERKYHADILKGVGKTNVTTTGYIAALARAYFCFVSSKDLVEWSASSTEPHQNRRFYYDPFRLFRPGASTSDLELLRSIRMHRGKPERINVAVNHPLQQDDVHWRAHLAKAAYEERYGTKGEWKAQLELALVKMTGMTSRKEAMERLLRMAQLREMEQDELGWRLLKTGSEDREERERLGLLALHLVNAANCMDCEPAKSDLLLGFAKRVSEGLPKRVDDRTLVNEEVAAYMRVWYFVYAPGTALVQAVNALERLTLTQLESTAHGSISGRDARHLADYCNTIAMGLRVMGRPEQAVWWQERAFSLLQHDFSGEAGLLDARIMSNRARIYLALLAKASDQQSAAAFLSQARYAAWWAKWRLSDVPHGTHYLQETIFHVNVSFIAAGFPVNPATMERETLGALEEIYCPGAPMVRRCKQELDELKAQIAEKKPWNPTP